MLVYLDPAASSSQYHSLLSSPKSLKSPLRWEMQGTRYFLKDQSLPEFAEDAWQSLCSGGGCCSLPVDPVAEAERESVARALEGFKILESRGLASKTDDEFGLIQWQLQDHAHAKLCAVASLCNPKPFATPRPDVAQKDMTRMELMLQLERSGLVLEQWAPSSSQQEPEPYHVARAGPRVLFLKPGAAHFNRLYLLALLDPALKSRGVTIVRHTGALALEDAQPPPPPAPLPGSVSRRMRGKQPDSSCPVPPPAAVLEDAPARTHRGARGQKHPKSHSWGPGTLTFKAPNSWQATCHRKTAHQHALGKKQTKCTRTRTFNMAEEEQTVLRQPDTRSGATRDEMKRKSKSEGTPQLPTLRPRADAAGTFAQGR